ncbi:MAG: hypothetical protein HY056_12595 [Proteobacteria bacterium]|nr:hypothetical protein [Pseudomonadota bacterium]
MICGRAAGLFITLLVLAAPPAAAQHHGDPVAPDTAGASSAAASPYASMTGRAVKALSDEQVADLRAGRGMGMALAAELNSYPGPVHVLEHADALELSYRQRSETLALRAAMTAEAIAIGEHIIAQEAALDALFAARRVTRPSLDAAVAGIAAAQGELRAAHLRYHLAMVEMLSPAQVERYAQLRGYVRAAPRDHGRDQTHAGPGR